MFTRLVYIGCKPTRAKDSNGQLIHAEHTIY